jgi:hypothetical protein
MHDEIALQSVELTFIFGLETPGVRPTRIIAVSGDVYQYFEDNDGVLCDSPCCRVSIMTSHLVEAWTMQAAEALEEYS